MKRVIHLSWFIFLLNSKLIVHAFFCECYIKHLLPGCCPTPQESCISKGYLEEGKLKTFQYQRPSSKLNRHSLITIEAIEERQKKEAQERIAAKNKELEAIHQANVEKAGVVPEPRIVTSPVPTLIEETSAQGASALEISPEDFVEGTFEKTTENPDGGKTLYIPFQMPFQPPTYPLPVPSQSVYETR